MLLERGGRPRTLPHTGPAAWLTPPPCPGISHPLTSPAPPTPGNTDMGTGTRLSRGLSFRTPPGRVRSRGLACGPQGCSRLGHEGETRVGGCSRPTLTVRLPGPGGHHPPVPPQLWLLTALTALILLMLRVNLRGRCKRRPAAGLEGTQGTGKSLLGEGGLC